MRRDARLEASPFESRLARGYPVAHPLLHDLRVFLKVLLVALLSASSGGNGKGPGDWVRHRREAPVPV